MKSSKKCCRPAGAAWLFGVLAVGLSVFPGASWASPPDPGVFIRTTDLPAGLPLARGVPLADGSALVLGAFDTAYRFNPTNQEFAATGSMMAAHPYATAMPLPDGRVLVASGTTDPSDARSEVYDPASNEWALSGSLSVARQWAQTAADSHGTVFVMGGKTPQAAAVASVERFDAELAGFVPSGTLAVARSQAGTVRLADGRIFLTGGTDAHGFFTRTAEIFDPASGSSVLVASPILPRVNPMMVLLSDNRVLVAGGTVLWGSSIRISETAEVYDPAGDSFSDLGVMNRSRIASSAWLLESGEVMIAGGYDDFGHCLRDSDVFSPTGLLFPFRFGPAVPTPQCGSAVVKLGDGSVLVAGGAGIGTPQGWQPSVSSVRFLSDRVFESGFEP